MKLGNAVLQTLLQCGLEVAGAVRNAFKIAGNRKNNVEVVSRGSKKIRQQFQVADVFHNEAWAEGLHQA